MAVLRIDWEPDDRKVREFGIGLVVFAAVMAALSWRKGHPDRAAAIASAGTVLGVLSAALPGPGRWVYKAWMCVAFVIGTVVSYTILAFIYFVVLTPMSLIGRLLGRDALRLKRAPAGESYWAALEPPSDPSYYERLF